MDINVSSEDMVEPSLMLSNLLTHRILMSQISENLTPHNKTSSYLYQWLITKLFIYLHFYLTFEESSLPPHYRQNLNFDNYSHNTMNKARQEINHTRSSVIKVTSKINHRKQIVIVVIFLASSRRRKVKTVILVIQHLFVLLHTPTNCHQYEFNISASTCYSKKETPILYRKSKLETRTFSPGPPAWILLCYQKRGSIINYTW